MYTRTLIQDRASKAYSQIPKKADVFKYFPIIILLLPRYIPQRASPLPPETPPSPNDPRFLH